MIERHYRGGGAMEGLLKGNASNEIKRPRDVRFWIAMAVFLVASAAFGMIAEDVATKDSSLQQDIQVSTWLHTHGNPVFSAFLLAISQLHSPVGVTVMCAILAFFLWRNGDRYWVLSLALAVPGGMLLNVILKQVFNRTRPVWDDPLLTLTSHSFPSGHAAGATLFYGFLAVYMVWRMKNASARVLAVFGCVLMVVLVSFSRVYLGVHYLSDVLGAVSLSSAWLVLCLVAVRAIAKRRAAATPAA
jgi:membrane-associated phospholipid phosphatase